MVAVALQAANHFKAWVVGAFVATLLIHVVGLAVLRLLLPGVLAEKLPNHFGGP